MREPSTAMALKVRPLSDSPCLTGFAGHLRCGAAPALTLSRQRSASTQAHQPCARPQVMDNYFHTSVPDPGKEWDFKPDPNLASVQYYRCGAPAMARCMPALHLPWQWPVRTNSMDSLCILTVWHLQQAQGGRPNTQRQT